VENEQPKFKWLTKEIIRSYTDSGSFSNGKAYARNGYIYDTTLRGATVQGRSRGQSGGPYKVRVTLVPMDAPGDTPIAEYECSCPRGGFCKHVVALLMVWLEHPERFKESQDPTTLLQSLTREELLALLTALLKAVPDLDRRVERLLPIIRPTAAGAAPATLDLASFRRQVRAILPQYENDWDYEDDEEAGEELQELLDLGGQYAGQGQWGNAAVIFSALVSETIKHLERYSGEEGTLFEIADEACALLGQCLTAQADLAPADRLPPAARADVIKTLFDAWKYNYTVGYGIAEQVPDVLTEAATPQERTQIEGWLKGVTRRDGFGSPAVARFIAALKVKAGLGDEAVLAVYREAGLYEELTIKLIEMGRVDEAVREANDFLPNAVQATTFAERLLGLGSQWVQPALTFVEGRLAKVEEEQRKAAKTKTPQRSPIDYQREQQHAYYLQWLERQYGLHQQPAKALELAQRRFELEPGERAYESVKQAAQLPGQSKGLWDETRPLLLADLEAQDLWGALINIHLREGRAEDARDALAALEHHLTEHRPVAWSSPDYVSEQALADLQLRVAQATETDHPAEARAVYQRLAENWIAQRGRASYQQAADYLLRVRDLYTRAGQRDDWLAYIADLRKRNKSLYALREELDAKKLE
jgi:uncharacterized Zn finger protein